MQVLPAFRHPKTKKRIVLTNDKHNTSVVLMVYPNEPLTHNQQKRSCDQLCGIDGCDCNKGLGIHGPQPYDIYYVPHEGYMIDFSQFELF